MRGIFCFTVDLTIKQLIGVLKLKIVSSYKFNYYYFVYRYTYDIETK